jgi:HAD superfamily hydrolase (TIGR01509 family)
MNEQARGASSADKNAAEPAMQATGAPAIDPFDPADLQAAMINAGGASGTKPEDGKMRLEPVKLLAFDAGHVFVRFDWDSVCRGFCQRANCTRERFKAALERLGKRGYERGKCSTVDFVGTMNEELGSNISLPEFSKLWTHTFEEDPDMADLLQLLGMRYPLFLVSNTNEVHYTYLQQKYNIDRHFKHLIPSYLVGTAKPDREYWQLLIQASGLPPHQILVVDDLKVNIEGANEVGLRTKLFVGREDLIESLPSFGVAF